MSEVKWDKAAIDRVIKAAAVKSVVETTIRLQNTVKLKLSRPGTGRVYLRGRTTTHRASAPGEPPAVDTGHLRRSWQQGAPGSVYLDRTGEPNPRIRVGTRVKYARYLEFGTRRMAPRPYVRPSVARVRSMFDKAVGKHLAVALAKLRPAR